MKSKNKLYRPVEPKESCNGGEGGVILEDAPWKENASRGSMGSMTHWLCVYMCVCVFCQVQAIVGMSVCVSVSLFCFISSFVVFFFLSLKDAIRRCRAADNEGCTKADANEKIRLEYARLLLLLLLPPLQPIVGQEISRKARKIDVQGALGRRRRQIGEEAYYAGKEGETVSPESNDARDIEIPAAVEEGIAAGGRERVLDGGDQGGQLVASEDKERWEEEGFGRGRGGGGDGGGGDEEDEEEVEEMWPVLVLSGWSTDEMEALLEVTFFFMYIYIYCIYI